jgi:chromosome segregation ATPase
MEMKTNEINEMRSRFHLTIEEKNIKIAYLSNEKHELSLKVSEQENELNDIKNIFELNRKDHIEFHTQIKILKQSLNEKTENVYMLTEELNTWMTMYHNVNKAFDESKKRIYAIEEKLDSYKKRL